MRTLLILIGGLSLTVLIACQYAYRPHPYEWQYKRPAKPTYRPVEPVLRVESQEVVVAAAPEVAAPSHETHYLVYRVRMTLKACSPQDPHDSGYYKRNGFKGATYNLCTDYRVVPKNAMVRLPPESGYMQESYPGKWWLVDAPIGVWGRRHGTGNGEIWADVKYRTHYSSKRFGTKHVIAEVVLPYGEEPSRVLLDNLVETVWVPKESEID